MTKETFDLMKKIDIQSAEAQLVLRCAPLLAGLKASNLLILKQGQTSRIQQLLVRTNICSYSFYQDGRQTFLLLYKSAQLESHLAEAKARQILYQLGYLDDSLHGLLESFEKRYQLYRMGQVGFPHEMGLFLGYPPEDVRGFMENHGENCLCTGYWKVYDNAQEKLLLFQRFDMAKEKMIRMLAAGVCTKHP